MRQDKYDLLDSKSTSSSSAYIKESIAFKESILKTLPFQGSPHKADQSQRISSELPDFLTNEVTSVYKVNHCKTSLPHSSCNSIQDLNLTL